jgi:hypothetical protein
MLESSGLLIRNIVRAALAIVGNHRTYRQNHCSLEPPFFVVGIMSDFSSGLSSETALVVESSDFCPSHFDVIRAALAIIGNVRLLVQNAAFEAALFIVRSSDFSHQITIVESLLVHRWNHQTSSGLLSLEPPIFVVGIIRTSHLSSEPLISLESSDFSLESLLSLEPLLPFVGMWTSRQNRCFH